MSNLVPYSLAADHCLEPAGVQGDLVPLAALQHSMLLVGGEERETEIFNLRWSGEVCLSLVSETLAKLYHMICDSREEIPRHLSLVCREAEPSFQHTNMGKLRSSLLVQTFRGPEMKTWVLS